MCDCLNNCNCSSTTCGCSATLSSVCVNYEGADLDSIGAVTGDNLERILGYIDTVILNLSSLVASNPIGINVGGGIELFKPLTADFRTFTDSTSIVASNPDADTVAFEIASTWIDSVITPITTDIATINSDIATINSTITTLQGDVTALQGDVATAQADIITIQSDVSDLQTEDANIRTTQGVAGGSTDLGTFSGTTITDNGSVKSALQELETAVEGAASSGEANTASNVGASGEGVFDGKVVSDLQFRKLDAISAYLSLALNGQKLDLDFDTPSFVAYLNTLFTEQANSTDGTSSGGAISVYQSTTGALGNGAVVNIKGVDSSASITPVDLGSSIRYDIDETWLTDFINNLITLTMGGVGQGNAKSYLFSAQAIADQFMSLNSKIIFTDDYSDGFYDYSNSWTNGQWVANSDAGADGDVEFNSTVSFEMVANGAITDTVTVALVHDTAVGGSETVLQSFVHDISALTTGQSFNVFFNSIKPSTSAISIAEGDKIFVKITAESAADIAQKVKVTSGNIYNTEV